ncbi:MAG: sodium:solute symporter family protein, partial [Candidatus Pelethousia sp.]|nr:sodium:solute symporter family protein [Candidatus Pelethousia sp.]
RIKSNADFVVAGRSLGTWILAATLAATEIGGGSSLGVVQQGMEGFGIRSAWYVVAVGVSYALLAFWAPTARRDNVKTTPEFFRRRYGDASGAIQAVLIILSLLGDAVAQYVVSGTIISVMLNIDFQMGLIISAVVVTTYSVLGGLWSISATDFVQMFLIFAGMAIVVPHAMQLAGGWSNVVAAVPAETLVFYQDGDLLYVVSLIVMFTTSLSSTQLTVSRFFAAKNPRAARQGTLLTAGIVLLFALMPAVLGVIMLALVRTGRFDAQSFANMGTRYALPMLAVEYMPPVVAGLLLTGVLAATMSTIDSPLLVCGTVFGVDIYKKYVRTNASDKQVLGMVKTVMIAVSILCFILSLFNTQGILQLIRFSYTLKAATAFVPYIAGHYWKRASQPGAIASMLGGAFTVLLCDVFYPGITTIHTIFPSIAVSGVCFVLFSLLMPPSRVAGPEAGGERPADDG